MESIPAFFFWGDLLREETDVLGADVVCGEEPQEGRALERGFDGGSAVGFFALDEADAGEDVEACFTCCFDCVDGGCAGGAYVVNDDDGGVLREEAFEPAACSVGFFCFPDEEAVDERRAGMAERVVGAGSGHIGDDGVRAHGEPADGLRADLVLVEEIEDGEAGEASTLGMEGGGAAVYVVIAGSAGGELKVAETKGVGRDEFEERLAVG